MGVGIVTLCPAEPEARDTETPIQLQAIRVHRAVEADADLGDRVDISCSVGRRDANDPGSDRLGRPCDGCRFVCRRVAGDWREIHLLLGSAIRQHRHGNAPEDHHGPEREPPWQRLPCFKDAHESPPQKGV